MSLSVLQGANACLEDRLGCREIRLANAERDHVFHRCGDVEKFPDARWLESGDSF